MGFLPLAAYGIMKDKLTTNDTQALIESECDAVKELLLAKNKAYGDSAANPMQCFSKLDAIERLKVRIDDKISRIARGKDTDAAPEDTELDLIGYLILMRVVRKQKDGVEVFVGGLGSANMSEILEDEETN